MSDWRAIGFSDALARSRRCGYRSRRSSCKRAEAARNAVLAIIAVQVEVIEGRESDQECRHTAVRADIEAKIVWSKLNDSELARYAGLANPAYRNLCS